MRSQGGWKGVGEGEEKKGEGRKVMNTTELCRGETIQVKGIKEKRYENMCTQKKHKHICTQKVNTFAHKKKRKHICSHQTFNHTDSRAGSHKEVK